MPIAGERVLFCIEYENNYGFVGEGYIDERGVWYRYTNYPLYKVFDDKGVSKWMSMPKV
jgi:hypothetical protein